MSRKGNCSDNAVAESFFSTLEFEGPATNTWRTVADAEPEMFRFIEGYYNATRLHSRNEYRTPNEVEADQRRVSLAAWSSRRRRARLPSSRRARVTRRRKAINCQPEQSLRPSARAAEPPSIGQFRGQSSDVSLQKPFTHS